MIASCAEQLSFYDVAGPAIAAVFTLGLLGILVWAGKKS
jgi:hypothetical protein